jgi:hypothetical protein
MVTQKTVLGPRGPQPPYGSFAGRVPVKRSQVFYSITAVTPALATSTVSFAKAQTVVKGDPYIQ